MLPVVYSHVPAAHEWALLKVMTTLFPARSQVSAKNFFVNFVERSLQILQKWLGFIHTGKVRFGSYPFIGIAIASQK